MRLIRLISLAFVLAAPAAAQAPAQAPEGLPRELSYYRNMDNVLAIMADSRKVRELKSAHPLIRSTFTRTLRAQVYDKVDQAVLAKVGGQPEYAGKTVVVHEFRTPGSDPNGINADRDARVLVEAEPGRWVEVPREHWEDTFYESFGKATGKAADVPARDHAGRYRQLATDRAHVEAGLDYSDQTLSVKDDRVVRASTIRQARDEKGRLLWERPGKPLLVSDSPIQAVKKAGPGDRTRLRDAEGLGLMYFEKGDEQLRRLADKGLDADKAAMHRAEAAVQIGKGAKSLDGLREAYARQGYDVGTLPENFVKASELVKAQRGDFSADPARLDRQLKSLGFDNGLEGFNRAMRGQIEALKLAPRVKPTPPPADTDLATLRRAAAARISGRGAAAAKAGMGLGGKVLEVLDFIDTAERIEKEAKSGQHLYIDLNQDDGRFVNNAKVFAATLIETTGIPGAMEAGWEADSAEKRRIEDAIRRGEAVDPLLSTARVMADVGTKAVKSTILDPIEAGLSKAADIGRWGQAVNREYAALDAAERQEIARGETRTDRLRRENAFDLGLIRKWVGRVGGDRQVGMVADGTELVFDVERGAAWTKDFQAEWAVTDTDAAKTADAADPSANRFAVLVKDWPAGSYEVVLTLRGRADGKVHGQERESFEVDGAPGLGTLTARLDTLDGPPLDGPVERGRVVAFDVAPLGRWTDALTVEWSVDGEVYKTTPGSGDKARLIRFRTDRVAGPGFTLSVRLLDAASGRILAHQERKVPFVQAAFALPSFTVRGARDDYDGPSLDGAARNGDILAFSAEIDFPVAEPPPIVNLLWEVRDAAGRPVMGLSKTDQTVGAGARQTFGFKFRPATLANGAYTVVLTQMLATDPSQVRRGEATFTVHESVRIERLVVAADSEARSHRDVLYGDEVPHLFAYYRLDGAKSVNADLSVADDAGRVLFSKTLARPDKPGGIQRVGVRLRPDVVKVGQAAVFSVRLTAPDGQSAEASAGFRVDNHQLGLSVPDRLKSGELARFRITPPEYFTPPFTVDLDSRGAVATHDGKLGGTLTGIARSGGTGGTLRVTLTDAAKRTATGTARFTVGQTVSPFRNCEYRDMSREERKGGVFEIELYPDYYDHHPDTDHPLVMAVTENFDGRIIMVADRPACVEVAWTVRPYVKGVAGPYGIADYPIELCGQRFYVIGEDWRELNRRFKSDIRQRLARPEGAPGVPAETMIHPDGSGAFYNPVRRHYGRQPIYMKEAFQGSKTRYCLISKWPE